MIAKNKKLIVLMPPKTASNSIKWLLEKLGYVFSIDPKFQYPQIHLKLSEIIDMYNVDNLEEYKVMQIVRDPYHRFVSSFYFQQKILPASYNPKFKNFNFSEFSNHLYESKKDNDFVHSFYGDNVYVDHCIKSGASWGGSRLYDTQSSWDDVGVNVTHFKLETLTNDVTELENYLEASVEKLPKINSQNLQNYSSLITPEIQKVVIDLFEDDFQKFDYIK